MGKGLTSINAESFSTTAIEPSIAQPSPASVNTYFSTANITRGLRSPSAAS
jgi:hypothetical protein